MAHQQDTESKIVGNLLLTPLENKSIRQIALDAKLSYVTVYKAIPHLLKRKVITVARKGKANLVSVDFEHAGAGNLSSAMLYQREIFLGKHPNIMLLLRELEEMLSGKFYSLLIFGSYVQGKAREGSDIDFLFIVPDTEKMEEFQEKINKAWRLYPKIRKDFKVVSTDDFKDMLSQKYTVGRSAFRQGIVLFGVEQYYSMVKKYVRTKGY